MMRRLRRFLALRPSERRLFIGAWLALPIIDLMLRGLGFQRTQRILGRSAALFSPGQAQAEGPAAVDAAEAKAGIISIAGRYALANGTCLRQALVLWWLLRRRGQAAELRIGVRTENGFAAHAWVELDGTPLGQTPEQRNRFVRMQVFRRLPETFVPDDAGLTVAFKEGRRVHSRRCTRRSDTEGGRQDKSDGMKVDRNRLSST